MTQAIRIARLFLFIAGLAGMAAPAMAELPTAIRATVDEAISTGDSGTVATVVRIAKWTNPDNVAELDALKESFDASQRSLAVQKAAAKERRIRNAGPLDNWSGRGQIGASSSSGNTHNLGLSVGLDLTRKGIDWQHHLKFSADIQRSNGVSTREHYFASYEPRYSLSHRAFAFAIAQFERNPFQGFSARYALSGGLGYHVFDQSGLKLSVKAGPAWRISDYVDGGSDSSLAALAGLDFDWAITDQLKLTQAANMLANAGSGATIIVDSKNTSINLVTGIEAKVSKRLSTRFSYAVDYDTNPPDGKVSTDTLSRVTLVYGF